MRYAMEECRNADCTWDNIQKCLLYWVRKNSLLQYGDSIGMRTNKMPNSVAKMNASKKTFHYFTEFTWSKGFIYTVALLYVSIVMVLSILQPFFLDICKEYGEALNLDFENPAYDQRICTRTRARAGTILPHTRRMWVWQANSHIGPFGRNHWMGKEKCWSSCWNSNNEFGIFGSLPVFHLFCVCFPWRTYELGWLA